MEVSQKIRIVPALPPVQGSYDLSRSNGEDNYECNSCGIEDISETSRTEAAMTRRTPEEAVPELPKDMAVERRCTESEMAAM